MDYIFKLVILICNNKNAKKYFAVLFEMAHALLPVNVQTREELQVETVLLGKFFFIVKVKCLLTQILLS